MLRISPVFAIPLSEIEFSFVRSSGPGGQNVNKVNSKAILRWNLVTSPSVPDGLRARLVSRLGPRLTRLGEVLIASDRYRDQGRNREDCLEKLRAILAAAAVPEKIRGRTRPTFSSKRKDRKNKSLHSDKKSLRQRPKGED